MTDVMTDTLAASFDAVQIKSPVERPMLSGARASGAAFGGYVRAGIMTEVKAFAGTSDAAGGGRDPARNRRGD